ncbi:MAG: sulfatase-like hydrolase/transferase [Gammaproteobacteria bacterium]|nr:sulfatase-like hydrolase/transferase [Gammaproteobacteria bacterium]
MGRKILFITADQMRWDALGCYGGKVARTPVLDALAAEGIRYDRAHNQNVVCMPARATMVTGQYVSTHGVWMNGVPLPEDAPSVAAELHASGYRTALIGKSHFEPHLDREQRFYENRMALLGEFGPHRGFEHMELATHSPLILHYGRFLREQHPEALTGFYRNLNIKPGGSFEVNGAGGGDTGACQVQRENHITREHYHTDWVADRTLAWLDSLDDAEDWFVWMSFPDPHHPWDPPASELHRVDWRELDLPQGYPGSPERIEAILAEKPRHWLDWWRGERLTNFEAPPDFVPSRMTPDQVREVNALAHVENELIDEAVGRVLAAIRQRGWGDDTDVVFTTDHGEFQGDFGLLFKGPYHVESLMRLPLIWRPAPNAATPAAVVAAPVGQVDLAPTFLRIAGAPVPGYMQGLPLPADDGEAADQRRERVFTEWDCRHVDGTTVSLRTLYRDGYIITACRPGTLYAGDEGELYDLARDPQQWRNLWNDPGYAARKSDLLADLEDHLPPVREPRMEPVTTV